MVTLCKFRAKRAGNFHPNFSPDKTVKNAEMADDDVYCLTRRSESIVHAPVKFVSLSTNEQFVIGSLSTVSLFFHFSKYIHLNYFIIYNTPKVSEFNLIPLLLHS